MSDLAITKDDLTRQIIIYVMAYRMTQNPDILDKIIETTEKIKKEEG